jgi:glutamate/aspartate transport system substrate-binding protein
MKLAALLSATALLVGCATPAADPSTSGSRLQKIRDTRSITLAYRTDAGPFSFVDANQQMAGYSVDLCRRVVTGIEEQLGAGALKVNWVPVTVENRFDTIAKGQADMECGSSTVTLGRMKTVDFSSFIFVDGTGLLVKTSTPAHGLSDLAGKRIGVIGGTSNQRALDDALKARLISATVVPLTSREEGLAQVESGAIDAFASDRLLLLGLATKAQDARSLSLLADALSFEPYAIALPRGDWQLRLAVNSALSQIYRGGAITEIYQRWFGRIKGLGPLAETTFLFGSLPE